jgi:sugar lactone lactonase YvrE
MRNRSLGWVAVVVGFGTAVACGGNSHTDFGPNDDGGAGGDSSGGTAGSGGKGGSSGRGGGSGSGGRGGTSGDGGTGGELPTSTLTVVIGEAPNGEAPEVTVSGPDGFSETITETTTFADIEPGAYSVTSDLESARVDGTIVDSIFDLEVSGSPANVDEGEETIEVSWDQRPGTGMLWLGNLRDDRVLGYTESQLAESNGSLAPAVVLNMPPEGTGSAFTGAIAFDATGTLWVGYCRGPGLVPQAIAGFRPSKLAASGSPEADVVIQTPNSPDFDCVSALAPDPDGGLWVGFMDGGGFAKYSAEQLQTSGAPTPAVSVGSSALGTLGDLLFDADGNLWSAAYASNRISKFTPEQLDESNASLVPDSSWTWSTKRGPVGLALSPGSGQTLWAAFYDSQNLAEFELGTAAGTDPAEVASVDSSVFEGGPELLTFDEQGNLWVSLYDSNEIARIDADDLVTGTQSPSVVIGGSQIETAYALRFNPPAE